MGMRAGKNGQRRKRLSTRTLRALAPAIALVIAVARPVVLRAMDAAEAARIAREYLDSDDRDDRAALAEQLAQYTGDVDHVLRALEARSYEAVEPGYHPEEHFTVPDLLAEYPDELLYFTVPKSYRPNRATGLIVFMHGGGNASSRRSPRYYMNFPDEDDDDSSQLGDLFDETGMIAVGPSAPWDEDCSYRWCLPESDDYLAAVIQECKSRFNIDADRLFLVGHSMGGFGAYHHVQRQPDRFAAVVVDAGSWMQGYWPVINGTKLCIVQGVEDAEADVRWHYTDIAYARWTDKLLSRKKLDYVYYEHKHGHWVGYGKPYMAKFFETARDLRRDPCHPHVVLASPLGFMRDYSTPVKHNRWLTLDEARDGEIEYDALLADEDVDFDDWRLEYHRRKREGSAIDAVNRGGNTIRVVTTNVAKFTVWLHPRMVDVRKPVTIVVDGETQFRGMVTPSLVTALESYERRGDWGLVYPIKVELEAPAADAE